LSLALLKVPVGVKLSRMKKAGGVAQRHDSRVDLGKTKAPPSHESTKEGKEGETGEKGGGRGSWKKKKSEKGNETCQWRKLGLGFVPIIHEGKEKGAGGGRAGLGCRKSSARTKWGGTDWGVRGNLVKPWKAKEQSGKGKENAEDMDEKYQSTGKQTQVPCHRWVEKLGAGKARGQPGNENRRGRGRTIGSGRGEGNGVTHTRTPQIVD